MVFIRNASVNKGNYCTREDASNVIVSEKKNGKKLNDLKRSLSIIIVRDDLGGAQLVIFYLLPPQSTGCGFVSKDGCRVVKHQLRGTFGAGQRSPPEIKTYQIKSVMKLTTTHSVCQQ